MTAPAIYTRADLMRLAGYRDRDAFRACLALWLEHEGFPCALAGTAGRRWSRAAVDAWFAGVRPSSIGHASSGDHAARPPGQASSLASGLAARRFLVIEGSKA